MTSLGSELRQARDKASLSVEQIAQQTKISLRLLKALEDERFDLMPESFFVKGVLKAYVRAVGGDEAYFLALYRSEQGIVETSPPPAPSPTTPKERAARASASSPSRVHRPELMDFREAPSRSGPGLKRRVRLQPWVLILGLILLAAVVTALVFFYLESRPKPAPLIPTSVPSAPSIVRPEAPAEAADKAGTTATPGQASSQAQPVPADGFAAGLKLDLRFTSETWIQVAADGRIVLDGIQAAGRETILRAAEEFIIQIGNAGGLAYTLNDKPGVALGALGAVRTDIRINRETAAEFLRNSPAPSVPSAATAA